MACVSDSKGFGEAFATHLIWMHVMQISWCWLLYASIIFALRRSLIRKAAPTTSTVCAHWCGIKSNTKLQPLPFVSDSEAKAFVLYVWRCKMSVFHFQRLRDFMKFHKILYIKPFKLTLASWISGQVPPGSFLSRIHNTLIHLAYMSGWWECPSLWLFVWSLDCVTTKAWGVFSQDRAALWIWHLIFAPGPGSVKPMPEVTSKTA